MSDDMNTTATQSGGEISEPYAVPVQHATSYGLADVLFPASPPKPKGARLVLGVIGMSDGSTEEQETAPRIAVTGPARDDVGASHPVEGIHATHPRPADHTRMHSVPPQKRRGNKAVRNRSLLVAAGLT
jgi:hypothetical protein